MSQRRPYLIFAACMMAPAAAGLVRKLVPGQPAALEIAGVFAVLAGGGWLLMRRRRLPVWTLAPLLVWAYFQLVYAAFAVGEDWRVGAVAVLTRIVPMLMAGVAYAAVRNAEDLREASKWIGAVAVALLPVGLLVALWGNDAVPFFLQPIERMEELGRAGRFGVPAVAGFFSTQSVMSMSMLAVVFLALVNAAQAEVEGQLPSRWWLLALSAMIMVFMSTRRGAFVAAAIGIVAYILTRKEVPTRLVIWGVVLIGVTTILDRLSTVAAYSGMSRAEVLLESFNLSRQIPLRLYHVFGRLVALWVYEAPFGTYLGFAGPEADVFVGAARLTGYATAIIEVGAVQLLAETGILGVILMPVIVAILAWQGLRQSRGMRCRQAVQLLLLYQGLFFLLYYMKEESMMTGVSMGQLFFWAVAGIVAALIERERLERRYWHAVWKYQQVVSQEQEGYVRS